MATSYKFYKNYLHLCGKTFHLIQIKILLSATDDVSRYCTWTEGRIDYPSVTLDVLFDRLSCIYNLDIRYTPRKLSGKTFSISLSTQENIKDVLDAIAVIMPVKWTKDDRTIIINEI